MDSQKFGHPLEYKKKVSEEPLQILEAALMDTIRQVSTEKLPEELTWWTLDDTVSLKVRMHPFLDRILNHLGSKNMF